MIILNHTPLKGSLFLDHQAFSTKGIKTSSAMSEISDEEKKPFSLVGDFELKEVGSCWEPSIQLKGATSEYVSNQCVHNIGWFKMSHRLSKQLKFVVVV